MIGYGTFRPHGPARPHAGTWTEHPLPPRDTEQAEEVDAA